MCRCRLEWCHHLECLVVVELAAAELGAQMAKEVVDHRPSAKGSGLQLRHRLRCQGRGWMQRRDRCYSEAGLWRGLSCTHPLGIVWVIFNLNDWLMRKVSTSEGVLGQWSAEGQRKGIEVIEDKVGIVLH